MTHLLLVEDNPSNRKLMSGILRRSNYTVDEARDADEARALLERESYALILMDIQLPGTDGLTLTQEIRNTSGLEAIPIIAVTAHAMAGDSERILKARCDAYLAKPINYKELLATIEAHLA